MKSNERPRILAVDDVADNLELIREILDGEPYELVTACGADEAMKLAREGCPDVAILDVQMPEMDGYELCRRLREEFSFRCLPVIFLTAHRTSSQDVVHGLDLGACDYVTKPFDANELLARVRAAVRQGSEREQHVAAAKAVARRLARG